MRKRRKTRDEQELAASLASASAKEATKREKRSRRSKKSQPATPEIVARPLFMSASLPAPPIPPVPVVTPSSNSSRPLRDPQERDSFDVNSIQNYHELLAALKAKKVQITLGNDIIAEDNILINYDVAINFNGHSIVSDESIPAARVFDIRSGEVTLTGKGKVFAMGDRSVALRIFGAISTEMPSYTTVTIDEGISLFSPSSYAVFIAANLGAAYGLRLNFAGEIIAHDGICLSGDVRGRHQRNLPTITLSSGARIVVDETSGAALHAAGYGIWEIGAVCLRGATGLKAQAGQISCTHTQMISNGPADLATFAIEPSDHSDLELSINGGTYISENSYVLAGTATSFKKLAIKESELHGALGNYPDDIRAVLNSSLLAPPPADSIAIPSPSMTLPTAPAPVAAPLPTPALKAPSFAPAQPLPLPGSEAIAESATPAEPPALPDEREATRTALADALSDLEKLRSADYQSGFAEFRRAVSQAKKVLRHSHSTLADIRDAASNLLTAFDNLEEHDDSSLSDEELDELFYHGAVLEEMTVDQPKPAKKPRLFAPSEDTTEKAPEISPESAPKIVPKIISAAPQPIPASAPVVAPVAPPALPKADKPPVAAPLATPATPVPVPTPSAAPVPPVAPALNFSTLREVITTIAQLDAQKYSTTSYQTLLATLTQAKAVIGREDVRQDEIDQISSRLLTQLAELEPAPALNNLSAFSAGAIDEMSPAPHWSTGANSIDDTTPFDYTNYQAPRASKIPRLHSPLGGFLKSLSAGARAGFATYRRARRTAKTS